MFHDERAPLEGILDPLKSDLGVFWAKIPLSSDWFYNVKTQKKLFLQNRPAEMAEIENIHCTICTQPISSSWQNALPPALVTVEQRGVQPFLYSFFEHSFKHSSWYSPFHRAFLSTLLSTFLGTALFIEQFLTLFQALFLVQHFL